MAFNFQNDDIFRKPVPLEAQNNNGMQLAIEDAPTSTSDYNANEVTKSTFDTTTDLSGILKDYDTKALQKEYGDIFSTYDDTRERFTEEGFALNQDLARLGQQRQQFQFGQQRSGLQDQQGFITQALDRSQRSLGLREDMVRNQFSALEESQDIADQRMMLQRQGLEDSQSALQQNYEDTRSAGRDQLGDIYRQQGMVGRGGFAGSGSRDADTQRARDRFTGNVGGRLSSLRQQQSGLERQSLGLDLSERESALRLDQQERGLRNQLSQFGIDREEMVSRSGQQLRGIDRQLSDLGNLEGFSAETFGQRQQLADLQRRESVFGLRDQFRDQTRGRLLDLIRSGADLSRFESGYNPDSGYVPDTTTTDEFGQDTGGNPFSNVLIGDEDNNQENTFTGGTQQQPGIGANTNISY